MRALRRRLSQVSRPRRGQAVIEFVLVLPVMLLITFGAVDVGRVFFDYVALRNAAMEGAVYGAKHPDATAEIKQRVKDHFLPNPYPAGATEPQVQRDPQCSGTASIDQNGFVTVTVSREFQPITLDLLQVAGPGADWTFTVRTSAKARCMT